MNAKANCPRRLPRSHRRHPRQVGTAAATRRRPLRSRPRCHPFGVMSATSAGGGRAGRVAGNLRRRCWWRRPSTTGDHHDHSSQTHRHPDRHPLAAAGRADGSIEPLPATLRGGAAPKSSRDCFARGSSSMPAAILLTDVGYAAVGKLAPSPRVSRKWTSPMPSRNAEPIDALLEATSRTIRPAPSWPRSSTRCATLAARPSPR